MADSLRRIAAALILVFAASAARADEDGSYRYFYEDIFRPLFALDASSGVYRAAREGALPGEFAAVKAPGTLRVFVVGGSIARMDGGRSLREALTRLWTRGPVEVVDCGMSGYDSPREELVVNEALEHQADVVVLMTGHNESLQRPWIPRWRLAAARLARRLGLARPTAAAPAPIGAERDAALKARLGALEDAVRRMARASAARGAAFAVFVPPLNTRDRPADGVLPRGPEFRAGWTLRLAGDCAGARRAWAEVPARPAAAASLAAFFAARCLEVEGRSADADAEYAQALSLEEPLNGRCGPACAESLRRAAHAEGAAVADGAAAFASYAAPRAPGFDEFVDAVHWRPGMDFLTTQAIVAALRAAGTPLAPGDDSAPPRLPARRDGEWTALLRSGVAQLNALEPDRLSPAALVALEYAAAHRPGPLDGEAFLAALERGSSARGAAWDMPDLALPAASYEWHLADAWLARGELARAGAAFAAAERLGPLGPAFMEDRAAYWRRARAPARADALLAAAHARSPYPLWDGDPREARARWCAAADPAAHVTCARLLLDLGDKDGARAQAERALADAKDAPLRREAALALQDAGAPLAALAELSALERRAPSDPALLLADGLALYRAGRRDEALPLLARAAALESEPGDGTISWATALDNAGRRDEARAALAAALARARPLGAKRLRAALRELDAAPR